VFQNPKERVVLLQCGKNSSAFDIGGKTARNQHLKTTPSPKKQPGAALLQPTIVHPPPVYVSDLAEVGDFSSVHYLPTDEVFGTMAVCVQRF